MALERTVVTRAPFIYFNGTLTAGQALYAAMGLSQTPVFALHGQKRLIGSVYSSVAPASAPVLRFNGTGSNSTFDLSITLVRDTTQSGFVYPFDVPLFLPYATLEMTDAGAGSTVKIAAWSFPEGSGAAHFSSGGGPTPPSPVTLTKAAIDISTMGDNTVIAASGSTTIRIFYFEWIAGGAVDVTYKDGATAYSAAMPFVATQGDSFAAPGGNYPITLTAGNGWVVNLSAAVALKGYVLYSQA